MQLLDYLKQFDCGEEFTSIDTALKVTRSKNSPWSVDFYVSRGKTQEEAKQILEEKQKLKKGPRISPANADHWINKGYSLEDAIQRADQYRKDIGQLPTLEKYVIRYGNKSGHEKWSKYRDCITNRQETFLTRASTIRHEAKLIRWFNTSKTKSGPVVKIFSYTDFEKYCDAVKTATKISVAVYGDLIDSGRQKLGIIYGKAGYALDHKFSKYGGFVNNIHPLIIGSYQNLQLLPKIENSRKGQYCSISLDEIKSYKTIIDDVEISQELKDKVNEIFIEQS
jgi:cell fate (sporulation/competence/biofilm development) regulator YmcA (YheA/YmcA/DUF963 family)